VRVVAVVVVVIDYDRKLLSGVGEQIGIEHAAEVL
jgi:hypothetical protein